MKQQLIVTVLCGLSLSTFGHEILNRHHETHPAELAHSRAKSPLSSRNQGSDENENCEPSGKKTTLNIAIACSPHPILDVSNASATVGFAIDVKASLAGFLNYSSGEGLIVNYVSETVVAIDLSKWGHKLVFPFVITHNISLQTLFEQGKKTSKEEASECIQKGLILISGGQYTVSVSEAWDVFIDITRDLSVALKTVIAIVKPGIFSANTSLNRLIEVIYGLASWAKNTPGVEYVLEHRVSLNLQVLLNAKSALGAIRYIWEELSLTDVERISQTLKTSVDVEEQIASLAGNSTTGANGIINVISKLVLFAHGRESLHILVEVLVDFIVKNKHNSDAFPDFRADVKNLNELVEKPKYQKPLKVVHKLLRELIDHNWPESGVSISGILQEIDDGLSKNSLKLVIRVLSCLKAKTSIQVAVSTLVLHFVELLTFRGGAKVLSLVTGVQISEEILNAGPSALTTILRGVTIDQLWKAPTGKALASIPILSSAVAAVDVELKASAIHLTVEEALENRASGGIRAIITEVIEGTSKHEEPPVPLIGSESSSSGQSGSTTKESGNAESTSSGNVGPVTFPTSTQGGDQGSGGDGTGKEGTSGEPTTEGDDKGKGGSSEGPTTEGGDKEKPGSSEETTTEGGDKGKGGNNEEPTSEGGDQGKGGSSEKPTTEGGDKGKGNGNEYGEIDINGLKGADGKEPSDRHKAQGKHRIHGKFYHGQEKHHQGHEKHHQGHEKHHQGHEKHHQGHGKHHQGHEKHHQEHEKHHQEHGKHQQTHEKHHAHE
ncbi:uncharacterized protein LOC135139645 [Zophobas morio]|uniref:uncharacterized protein LOC135139645 n=1 Tax=Zophobas morio TaxID=2755281 RepID=UPI003083229D